MLVDIARLEPLPVLTVGLKRPLTVAVGLDASHDLESSSLNANVKAARPRE